MTRHVAMLLVVGPLFTTGCNLNLDFTPDAYLAAPDDLDPASQAWAVGTDIDIKPGTHMRLKRPDITFEPTDGEGDIIDVGEWDGTGEILRPGTFDVVSRTGSGKEVARVSLEAKPIASYRLGVLQTREEHPDVLLDDTLLVAEGGYVIVRPVPLSAEGDPLFGLFPMSFSSDDATLNLSGSDESPSADLEAGALGPGQVRFEIDGQVLDYSFEVVPETAVVGVEIKAVVDRWDDRLTWLYVTGRTDDGRAVFGVQADWTVTTRGEDQLTDTYSSFAVEDKQTATACYNDVCAEWSP